MCRAVPILALFAGLALFPNQSQACTLTAGDIDASGTVTSVDVQLAILAALDVSSTPDADINFDGVFTSVDVQLAILAALDVSIDSDGDGLSDAAEETLGTRPDLPDTDGDGIEDGQEICDGTDPNDPNSPGEARSRANTVQSPVSCSRAERSG